MYSARSGHCSRPGLSSRESILQKASELPRSARVLELSQRFSLDLSNSLARYRKLLAHFFQACGRCSWRDRSACARFVPRVASVTPGPRRSLAQIRLNHGVDRQDRVLVFDQIAEVGILFLANRRLERKWLLDDLQNFAHPFDRQAELFRKFFRSPHARCR